jgi:two-component system cell cycle sensor histidine kinase/response regulator CckA
MIDPTPNPLEERLLLLAWKETLADLIPGLTHDFNNVLTGILTLSEGYLAQIDPKHPFHEGLSLIKQKSFEASQLIHRMARLYQEKAGALSYQDVNTTAAEVVAILRKVTSKCIEISAKLASESLPVYVDAVEFRRVLLAAALSAINAKAGEGKLQFQTSRHDKPRVPSRFKGQFPRSPVVCLSIAGFGAAFAADQFDLAFQPSALSTENLAGGSLHLHQARIFVERSHGAITVESTPKAEATLHFWLPQADFTEGESGSP